MAHRGLHNGANGDTFTSTVHRYSLGLVNGTPYLSIPVSNGPVDYEEHYRLDPDEYDALVSDSRLAAAFAARCRDRLEDGRLIVSPGSNRGVPT
jgi:hypothetical protein